MISERASVTRPRIERMPFFLQRAFARVGLHPQVPTDRTNLLSEMKANGRQLRGNRGMMRDAYWYFDHSMDESEVAQQISELLRRRRVLADGVRFLRSNTLETNTPKSLFSAFFKAP